MFSPGYILASAVLTLLTEDVSCQESSVMSNEKVLKDKIFKNYDKLIRPLNGSDISTHVRFVLCPKFIVDVDEDKSLFTLDSYLFMTWNDPRLTWNSTEFNIKNTRVTRDKIWSPDLSIWNSHSSEIAPYQNTPVSIWYSGKIILFAPATTGTFCSVAEEDEVTCVMEIGCWTHDAFDISIDSTRSGRYMGFFKNQNPRWKLKEEAVTTYTRFYNVSSEEIFMSMEITFPMVRHPAPQLRLVRVPCVLGSVLVLALLCAPPQEYFVRFQLGAFLFFVMNMLMVYASATATTLQAAKSAVSLVRSTTIVLIVFLAMQVVTMKLNHCSGPSRPNEALVRWLSSPLVGRVLFWKSSNSGAEILSEEGEIVTTEPSAKDEWTLIAAAIDRVLFVICMTTMLMLLLVN